MGKYGGGGQIPGTSSSWWQYFFMVTPNICGSQVRNSLLITLLLPRILKWLFNFWKIYAPLVQGHLNFNLEGFDRNYQHKSNITAVCIVSPDIICAHLSGFCHTDKDKMSISQVRYLYSRFCYPRWLGIRGAIVGREDIQTQASMVFYMLPELHLLWTSMFLSVSRKIHTTICPGINSEESEYRLLFKHNTTSSSQYIYCIYQNYVTIISKL
jgi:hypothetical protein